jgi:hypothetical protein
MSGQNKVGPCWPNAELKRHRQTGPRCDLATKLEWAKLHRQGWEGVSWLLAGRQGAKGSSGA